MFRTMSWRTGDGLARPFRMRSSWCLSGSPNHASRGGTDDTILAASDLVETERGRLSRIHYTQRRRACVVALLLNLGADAKGQAAHTPWGFDTRWHRPCRFGTFGPHVFGWLGGSCRPSTGFPLDSLVGGKQHHSLHTSLLYPYPSTSSVRLAETEPYLLVRPRGREPAMKSCMVKRNNGLRDTIPGPIGRNCGQLTS